MTSSYKPFEYSNTSPKPVQQTITAIEIYYTSKIIYMKHHNMISNPLKIDACKHVFDICIENNSH